MNQITVLFFATLRERAGTKQATLEMPDQARVADLKRRLREEYPALAPALDTALVSVNRQFAFDDDLLPAGAEAAVFPPGSRGARGLHPPRAPAPGPGGPRPRESPPGGHRPGPCRGESASFAS
jgi:molybdopterin converting factor small subunit